MIIMVAVAFIVSWSPFYLVTLVSQLQKDSFLRRSNFVFTMLAIHLAGFTSSALNPFIYHFMSDKFRKSFCHIFRSIVRCGRGRLWSAGSARKPRSQKESDWGSSTEGMLHEEGPSYRSQGITQYRSVLFSSFRSSLPQGWKRESATPPAVFKLERLPATKTSERRGGAKYSPDSRREAGGVERHSSNRKGSANHRSWKESPELKVLKKGSERVLFQIERNRPENVKCGVDPSVGRNCPEKEQLLPPVYGSTAHANVVEMNDVRPRQARSDSVTLHEEQASDNDFQEEIKGIGCSKADQEDIISRGTIHKSDDILTPTEICIVAQKETVSAVRHSSDPDTNCDLEKNNINTHRRSNVFLWLETQCET